MPTRKSTKTSKSTKKPVPIRPLYGVAIYDAMERGDAKEMQALAKEARKQVTSVKTALAALEKKMGAS
jgi:Domain of unknown function (DUF1843)